MKQELVQMETQIEGLYASPPLPLPFAPELHIRAFVLRRSRGNVLIYSAGGLESQAAPIEDLGGISRWYLNHGHEAMFMAEGVTAPLFVNEADAAPVAAKHPVRGTFSRRHMLDEDLEVIPTPGHTPGATAYLWDSGRHRFLFTGDSIYLDHGEWVGAVLESSDRAAYLQSLELIGGLDFDVLVPWAATGGQPYYDVVSRAEASRRIGAIADRLRNGEDR